MGGRWKGLGIQSAEQTKRSLLREALWKKKNEPGYSINRVKQLKADQLGIFTAFDMDFCDTKFDLSAFSISSPIFPKPIENERRNKYFFYLVL